VGGVTDRRHRAAIAFLAEVVAALNGRGWVFAFGQPGGGRLQPGQHPMGEGAARGVGILAQHRELHGVLGHPGPFQRRGQIVVVLAWRAGIGWWSQTTGCVTPSRP